MAATLRLNVLLVDDDKNICRTLKLSLRDLDCEVTEANSVAEALREFSERPYDLVLSDFRMEGQTGLDLIKELKRRDPNITIVIMTAFASVENAVAMVKEGAFDYLPKPFNTAQLTHLLHKVRLVVGLKAENRELKRSKQRQNYFAGFTSPASRRLEEFMRKVAPTDATILLVGESGTGKSALAKLVHEWSPRAAFPFVTVQCTSLTESLLESELFGHVKGAFTGATQDKKGKLEAAEGGTVFLDEIGDMPPAGQAKLLRFLQDRVFERVGGTHEMTVDARIIAATNKNLEDAVAQGKFREDLYYRLNILETTLVPLRFRREDIPVLIQRFLAELSPNSKPQIPEGVTKALLAYDWPGNVRELRNAIERVMMLSSGRTIELTDLPESIQGKPPRKPLEKSEAIESLETVERQHIQRALETESNLEAAAEKLGITTVTLWRKRKQYGLT
jgi:DNA-binding NtrC family response regulator